MFLACLDYSSHISGLAQIDISTDSISSAHLGVLNFPKELFIFLDALRKMLEIRKNANFGFEQLLKSSIFSFLFSFF